MMDQLHITDQAEQRRKDELESMRIQLEFVRLLHAYFPAIQDFRGRTPEEVKRDGTIDGIPIDAQAELRREIEERESQLTQ